LTINQIVEIDNQPDNNQPDKIGSVVRKLSPLESMMTINPTNQPIKEKKPPKKSGLCVMVAPVGDSNGGV